MNQTADDSQTVRQEVSFAEAFRFWLKIGFMAGWNNAQGMNQTTTAIICALLTTYTTFLPCFIYIFLGGHYIEILRGNKYLTGALTGVTPAVGGVILNLALVFGVTVIFPQGSIGSRPNWLAVVMSFVAFVALYKFKIEVLWIVLTGGFIGLITIILF